jgi:hypothetical protein
MPRNAPGDTPRITIEQFRAIWPADAPAMRIYRFEIERIGFGDAPKCGCCSTTITCGPAKP